MGQYIESHEEAAEAFVWASAVVLALMLLPMVLPGGRVRTAAALGACLGDGVDPMSAGADSNTDR